MQFVVKIQGTAQHYVWGGSEFIPQLLCTDNQNQKPFAEYWLGIHPAGHARTENEGELLSHWLEVNQQAPLAYLFKILDVRHMLSIQVHPTKAQAAEGFARENASGIPLDAANRNYKDANDKPELMLALSPFWLLHGLRSQTEIAQSLATKPYLAPLQQHLNEQGVAAAFKMALDARNADVVLMQSELKHHISSLPILTDKYETDFWLQRWLKHNPNTMTGLLTLYFMNLVELQPGQAIFQPPGLLHAYLEGKNVELMANSDNVLRAGLTPKHIDVLELLKIGTLTPTNAADYIITPQQTSPAETAYPTPFDEFELSEINLAAPIQWQSHSTELLFCYHGDVAITIDNNVLMLSQGESAVLTKNQTISLKPNNHQASRLFRVQGSRS